MDKVKSIEELRRDLTEAYEVLMYYASGAFLGEEGPKLLEDNWSFLGIKNDEINLEIETGSKARDFLVEKGVLTKKVTPIEQLKNDIERTKE